MGRKMKRLDLKHRLPGLLAAALVILTTSLWTFWGIAELYYEGWGLPFPQPLAYLIPAAVCLLFSLLALRWPRLGGWILVIGGTAFTFWWWGMIFRRFGALTLTAVLSMIPLSALLVLTGILFLFEERDRRRKRETGQGPAAVWWRRNLGYLLAAGIPLLVIAAVSASQLPPLLNRYDDGGRGERRIRSPGVDLVWAPAGPGWNWRQTWGGYPSWNALALYGQPPLGLEGKSDLPARADDMQTTGLCAYLTADGLTLADTPQYLWRMPTAAELVRSLTRAGQNAGCDWQGELGQAVCAVTPDKETPLWDPTAPPIYYWAADEFDPEQAYYVNYQGVVSVQPKTFGNPRHGYRCVREP